MENPVVPYESVNGHQAASMSQGVHQSDSPVAALSKGPPEYGLLSRTLIHSSVVKQILPARIRRDDLNDVVFIGETFIELHLLLERGTLQQAGSKTNFNADIRQARVFGSQRRPNMSGVDQSVSIHATESQDIKLHLPADILALTMDSGHLAFVYAKNCKEQGQVEFIISRKRIDSRGSHPTHLGRSIAVDPRSRALAVAAYQDNFRIFSLHPMQELHRQMEEGLPLNPIKEEKSFQIKGLIIHMEFLYPSPDEEDRVILLLFLIDSHQQSRLQLYEWWTSRPLNTATKLGQNGLRLSEDITMPLLIIPLVISSSFLIVTEYSIHAMRVADIMSGNAKIAKIPLMIGNQRSLVTAWARPFRAPVYSVAHDDMYLALENGQIYFLEVDSQAHMLVQTATNASKFDCAIGTAFSCLDYGLGNDDMLVAGGEMSSGGIYLLKIAAYPKKDLPWRMQESVTNWAPVFDFELVNLPAQGQSIGGATRDRVFAITGRGEHGAITELRYGLQARLQGRAAWLRGVQRLFILPDAAERGYFVLSSLADSSALCFLNSMDGNWNICDEMTGLELDEPTLAAGSLEKRDDKNLSRSPDDIWLRSWAIQITPSTITVAHLHDEGGRDLEEQSIETRYCDRRLQRRCQEGDTIVAAAIHRGLVLLAMRTAEGVINLILASIDIKKDSDQFLVPIGPPLQLGDDPSFVSLVELSGERLWALVGTRQATVQFYECVLHSRLRPCYEKSMIENLNIYEKDLFICESAVVMATENAGNLVCGLRGGTVMVFDITISGGSISTKKTRGINFGPIPVQLQPDYCRQDSAFILAGPELYRFDMPQNNFRATQIIFKDIDVDPVVQAIIQIDNSPDRENIIVCATKDDLIYVDVDQSENMCGRRLKLNETPRRVLFYRPLNVLIVACSRRDDAVGQKKKSFCTLKFIDPKTGADRELKDTAKEDTIFRGPDEQIYAITEWNMQLQGKAYRYLALGTGLVTPDLKQGRLIILSLTTDSFGKIQLKRRFQIECEAPVYSVCAFGDNSIIYCMGNQLCFRTLNIEKLKLDMIAEIRLRSPAVQMTVTEPFIHLSTAADSLLVIKFEKDALTESFSDEVARNGLNHFNLHPDFILATDKQYGLVGLWRPNFRRSLECLTTIFETELTSSISRIRRGHCRPPWATPNSVLPGVITGPSAMLAAGIDGSFFQLTLLDQRALLLLQYVQEIIFMQDDMGAKHQIMEPDKRDPRAAHINGDMLLPLEKYGSAWLCDQVTKGSPVAVARFKDAAVSLLGEVDDVWESVVLYIRCLLNDAVL